MVKLFGLSHSTLTVASLQLLLVLAAYAVYSVSLLGLHI